MPLFISDDDLAGLDPRAVAAKADAVIGTLSAELESVKAQADATAINAEQTCSMLEDKYISLQSQHAEVLSRLSDREAEVREREVEIERVKEENRRLRLEAVEKDGENERIRAEVSQLHASRRQLMELVEQKDAEISEKNATIKSYLDKIVNLTDAAAEKEAHLSDLEAEVARTQSFCERLSQEKDLVERRNLWLNEELTAKFNSLMELRKRHSEQEAELSAKLADMEKQFNDCSSSLKWYKEKVKDLEMKLSSAQENLAAAKDLSAASEERYSNEIATLSKLVDLYKESSEEWSKKAGDLEGVIKALEAHLSQVENEYKENFEKEETMRKCAEKEIAELKEKLLKSEALANQKVNELGLLPSSRWTDAFDSADVTLDDRMLVPSLPTDVSGTALAASLLRDGWSLAKMYAKYQEAVDAFRHEQMGRQQSQAILERVLSEIEEKASIILDERAEHERMAEAHYALTQKLQQSLSEQAKLEKVILELNAALRRQERESNVTAKEVVDLQKQVTILLKECHDIQLRFGSVHHESASANATAFLSDLNAGSDVERVISEQLLTFKDINGLVEQNVKLRSLVRSLSDKIDVREAELKEQFEMELQKHNNEAASKISVVLERAEEQGRMIESLHSSVSMYKRLYEEEHNSRLSHALTVNVASANQSERRKDQMLLLDSSQESTKKPQEPSSEHLRSLEEDLIRCRSEIAALQSERDKAVLEAQFSRERLERYTEEMDHQREEANGILARNVELSNLIIDYQKKLHERSDSLIAAEEHSRRLTTEVAVLRQEKELLSNSEKRACEEVRDLSERVHRLQASQNAIQSTEEIREEARTAEKRKQEEYLKKIEREWAEAKKELQEERDNARTLSLDRDRTIKDAMQRVEGMGKELSKVLHDLSAAEARAAVAVERYSDLERKYKKHVAKVGERGGGYDLSSSSANEIAEDLITLKEEIERLKSELQASKDHMLQYKSIAEVNEGALKQMENANINFKAEADKLRSSLEAEILSLRDRMFELEQESSLRSKELAAVTAEKDEALALALAEIANLKDVNSAKIIEVESMEVQIRALREEVDREHKRWRVAQDNYERQVILQSDTIKELTQTSQALLSLQDEASELRKCVDAYKRENDELKAKWVVETSILVEAKNKAEKKYSEINEQNKILHDRLEAMHIKLAEKDRYSAGLTSGISNTESEIDSGLQTVMNYLRRSKEIAETEISLLKQEKLRLQSQLERAQREVEEARADRASTRTLSFTEDEFKSLQLQVRELNILRESNCQLREENKHNFNECQKLREVCEKAKLEAEHLSTVVKERETEVAFLKMEIERERSEKGNLEDKISELLERCSQVDVEDYQQMKADLQQMQGKMKERGVEIEKMGKLISEKEEIILSLRQDLTGLRVDLVERESRISQVEAQMKVEFERQRRMTTQLKRKLDLLTKEKESLLGEKSSLLKEKESLFKEKELLLKEKATLMKDKEELGRESHALSKQVEDFRQGKKAAGDSSNEQDLNEALKEKETRIQTLERTVERLREDLKRQKVKAIVTKTENVDQEKKKIEDEKEKLKQASRKMPNELEKLKHAKDSIPEAVEDFERASLSILPELGSSVPVGASSAADTAAAAGEREKKVTMPRVPAKAARKLIRPKLGRSEEPQGDTELPEMEVGRSLPTHDEEKQFPHPAARKRPASTFASEPHEDLPPAQAQIDLDSEIHTLKKLKGSEFPKEDPEFPSSSEILEAPLNVEVPSVSASDLPQDVHEDVTDTEQDGIEISKLTGEPSEVDKDDTDQADMMIDNTAPLEENIHDQSETDSMLDDGKTQSQQEQQQTVDIDDREEGELEPEYLDGGESGDMIDGMDAVQTQSDADPILSLPSPVAVEETSPADEDLTETVPDDAVGEKNDEPGTDDIDEDPEKSNDVNNETDPVGEQSVADESPLTPAVVMVDEALAAAAEATDLKEDASSSMTNASEEAKEVSPSPAVTEATHAKEDAASSIAGTEESKEASPSTVAGSSSTTINLNERARLRSALRLGQATPTAIRGRVRQPIRGRAVRGARGGRRPTAGDQS
ncbi:hypothetical protein Droror1_Dr00016986 [Drosera rotundifolia]